MTNAPDRTIAGLTPRRSDAAPLARLVKAQRTTAGDDPAPAVLEHLPSTQLVDRRADAAVPGEEPKDTISPRIPRSLRNRSRAAFLATRTAEADESYSDFIAKAIAAEVQRREARHNAGEPFTGGSRQLPAGRPFTA